MAKATIDRRVGRTRAALHHALMSLIVKKGYEAITVEDICETANIGRSTFYAHYTGKDDLKRRGLDEALRKLLMDHRKAVPARPGGLVFDFSLPMFQHARDHIDLYRALAGGRGGSISLGHIRALLSDLVRGELAVRAPKNAPDAIPIEVVVQYTVGAYMALLTWWLEGGAKLPPDRIDAMFQRLATEGVLKSSL